MPDLGFEERVIVSESSRVGDKPSWVSRGKGKIRANFRQLLAMEAKGRTEYDCEYGTFDLLKILQIMPMQNRVSYRKEIWQQNPLPMEYDVFISHAGEDKQEVALPLVRHLRAHELRVWIDEEELELGDSLRRSIDVGLAQSKFGVVILSPSFFAGEWPKKELDALLAREDGSQKVILPVLHNIGAEEVVRYSPLLAGKFSVSTHEGLGVVAEKVARAVAKSSG